MTIGATKLVESTHFVPIMQDGKMVGAVSIDVTPCAWDDNGVWIARVFTPEKYRGQGYARTGLRQLCAAADAERVNLHMSPNSYGPMKNRDLVHWVKRLGFVKRKGSDIGYVRE